MEISISAETALGLSWPQWKRLVPVIEQLGFAGIFVSDHFDASGSPQATALELIVALAYIADHTSRVHFGSLVAPLSVRDPIMLVRQAAALDALSGGRMRLGLGAGWDESEHTMFGYPLGDVATRMDRLGEGLAIATGLLRTTEPFSYDGRFYHVHNAVLAGPRRVGGPPLLIGGKGPKRTLPLVARYADIWNAQKLTPEGFRQHSALLDTLLDEVGRPRSAVKRTLAALVFCGRTEAELEQHAGWVRLLNPDWADPPIDTLIDNLRPIISVIAGTPEAVVQQINAYAAVGVEELMIQWGAFDDLEGLELLAEQVLPYVST